MRADLLDGIMIKSFQDMSLLLAQCWARRVRRQTVSDRSVNIVGVLGTGSGQSGAHFHSQLTVWTSRLFLSAFLAPTSAHQTQGTSPSPGTEETPLNPAPHSVRPHCLRLLSASVWGVRSDSASPPSLYSHRLCSPRRRAKLLAYTSAVTPSTYCGRHPGSQ